MKDDNKYVFPCGDKFSAIDVGYCQGVKVATIANGSINWGTEKCANCKLANFREFYTGGETNLVCLAYSEEYLKNKDKQVFMLDLIVADYTIELILLHEDFKAVIYVSGATLGAGLLDLIDEASLEDYFTDAYDENTGTYFIWMTDSNGKVQFVEFESISEIARSIVSAILIKLENNEDE